MIQDERTALAPPDPVSPAPAPASPEHLMLVVQSLRGAPASVLLALGFAGRFLTIQELQVWTRCGHVQIALALRSLNALGWVRRRTSRGPWALVTDSPLPVRFFVGDRFDLKAISSSGDSLNTVKEEIPLPNDRSDRFSGLIQALYSSGVREPTATELSELPHVTLEYVQAHLEAARANGLRVGAAIQAMRLGAPPPAVPSRSDRQAEVEEKIRRFMEAR